MPNFWSQDTRRRTIAWIVGIVLTIVLVGVSAVWLGGTPPPSKIVLATGQPGGVYDSFGREYQKRLRAQGLKVELVNTAGSVDNFRRIIDGKADVAFAQSGTYQVVSDPEHKVSGLAAIYYEPLWIFARRGIRIEDKIAYREGSVAVGPKGSGTEAVAKAILAEQGYDITSPAIVNLTSAEARRQLIDGKLDVAFFVISYRDPGIMELMRSRDLQLTSFRREAAYTRKFRGLTPLPAARGPARPPGQHPARERHAALAVGHAGRARGHQSAGRRAGAQGRPGRAQPGQPHRPAAQVPDARGRGRARQRGGRHLPDLGRVLPVAQPALPRAALGAAAQAPHPAARGRLGASSPNRADDRQHGGRTAGSSATMRACGTWRTSSRRRAGPTSCARASTSSRRCAGRSRRSRASCRPSSSRTSTTGACTSR